LKILGFPIDILLFNFSFESNGMERELDLPDRIIINELFNVLFLLNLFLSRFFVHLLLFLSTILIILSIEQSRFLWSLRLLLSL